MKKTGKWPCVRGPGTGVMMTQRTKEEVAAARRWLPVWSHTLGRAKKIKQAAALKTANSWSGQVCLQKTRAKLG